MLSLIFFACLPMGCEQPARKEITLTWKDHKATGLQVPRHLLAGADEDSLAYWLEVKMEGADKPPIMGDISVSGEVVQFSPLIPFSRGLAYHVYFHDKEVGRFVVPRANHTESPVLLAVYPSNDTLPENLLKMYLQFSKPMRTGQSLKHISLLDENNDTLQDVFLELQPELWNIDNTVLTVWLDPGRIKRDLIPNEQLGNPLITGKKYKLVVHDSWKDVQDLGLRTAITKSFRVTGRDERSPEPSAWKLVLPEPCSKDALQIHFNESLDYFLLPETVQLTGEAGNKIEGEIQVLPEEKGILFLPKRGWLPGKYALVIAPHLEDLAGNNLEKIFDRDLKKKVTPSISKINFTMPPKK